MGIIKQTILDNGVCLVSEKLPQAYSVTLGLWTRVGSRDENPALGGVSHFIEHMAFKGTARRSPQVIAREIDRLGGQANAFTSKEHTCYHARALSERLEELSDLLLDLLLSPAYDPVELERERQVILQEINSQEDTPDELVHVLFGQNFWPGHSLGRPVLGTTQTVSDLGREAILEHLGFTHRPQGIVVSAVGQVEHEHLLEIMAGPLGALPANGQLADRASAQAQAGLHVYERNLEQVHLVLGHPAPSAVAPERFCAALLNLILGGNMSSRLFQEVRERRGMAYAVYSFLNLYSDSGMQAVYLGISPERTTEAVAVVREEMRRLAREPVDPQELLDAQESLKGSILLSAENPESRMSRLARNQFLFGRDITMEEVVQKVEAVTVEDIFGLCQETFREEKLMTTVLGPVDGAALSAAMDG